MRQRFNRLGYSLQRWMAGRNGQDALCNTMLTVAIILAICAAAFNVVWLLLPSYALLILNVLRCYSRNLTKRRRENAAFLRLFAPFRRAFSLSRRRLRDRKTYRYFKCPKCKQVLRVPKGRGKLMITCSKCGERFEKKS